MKISMDENFSFMHQNYIFTHENGSFRAWNFPVTIFHAWNFSHSRGGGFYLVCAWFDCHTYSRLDARKNHLLVTNNDILHPRFQRVISHEIESTQTDSCVSETTMKNPWQVIYNILPVINVLLISRLYYYTVTNWAKSADYPIVNQWALMCLLGSGD